VTLIAFDLKGAFNGVNKISLDARLRAKGIPAAARKWIASFMSDRFASIGFDDFRTEVALLVNAGLAQVSPLSPILFTFFNSDLVDQPVTFRGGASAFIDDYFGWRVTKPLSRRELSQNPVRGYPSHRSMGATDWVLLRSRKDRAYPYTHTHTIH
jgi:hypothetical protein